MREARAYPRNPLRYIHTEFQYKLLGDFESMNSRISELVSISQDPGESVTRIMPDPEAESGVAPPH